VADEGRRRLKAWRRGQYSELFAALYLLARGYRILAIREKTPLGEIDLIIRRRDLVAIVEVKARKSVEDAVNAVTYASQKRIRNASDLWLARQKNAHQISLRYDIVAVIPWRLPVHLMDAF
jgi:putative endonuclease